MKKLLLLLTIVLLVSCGADKRLYRPGWYIDRHHAKNNVQQEKEAAVIPERTVISPDSAATKDTAIATAEKPAAPAATATPPSSLPASVHAASTPSAPVDPPMSYQEARRRMAEQGCSPHAFATTIYYLGFASLLLGCIGASLLPSLVTLILSIFATNAVIARGECVDENLAVISLGKRLAVIGLLIMAVISLLMFIMVLVFFFAAYR